MTKLVVQPAARRYFKKLNDRKLQQLFNETITAVLDDPSIGEMKHADLRGIHCVDIHYQKTSYELACCVVESKEEDAEDNAEDNAEDFVVAPKDTLQGKPEAVVVILLAGTRENFYKELRRHWKTG